MKKPKYAKPNQFLINIPIFGAALYLIFYHNHLLLSLIPSLIILLYFITATYVFIASPEIDETSIYQGKHQNTLSIISILAIMPVTFILIYTPFHYLAIIHPDYHSIIPIMRKTMQYGMMLSTLVTVILAEIIRYFYFYTQETGWLPDTTVTLFKRSAVFRTALELYLSFGIQAIVITLLSSVILALTYLFTTLFNMPMITKISLPCVLICYAYLMLPKIPYFKRLLIFLNNKGWETGHFYLFSTVLALIIWLSIHGLVWALPTSWTGFIHGQQLLSLQLISPTTAWLIAIICFSLLLAPLLATILVRLQQNQLTYLNLPIALFYCLYLLFLVKAGWRLTPTLFGNSICLFLMIGLIIWAACYMKGNQINVLGFLANKNQIKTRKQIKYLIPGIQSITIAVAAYCLGGIYLLFFGIYLASIPTLIIMGVTIVCFPILKRCRHISYATND